MYMCIIYVKRLICTTVDTTKSDWWAIAQQLPSSLCEDWLQPLTGETPSEGGRRWRGEGEMRGRGRGESGKNVIQIKAKQASQTEKQSNMKETARAIKPSNTQISVHHVQVCSNQMS